MKTDLHLENIIYFQETGEEYLEAPEDTFYELEGRKYKRFYKGQEIPKEIYNDFFGVPALVESEQAEEAVKRVIPPEEAIAEVKAEIPKESIKRKTRGRPKK